MIIPNDHQLQEQVLPRIEERLHFEGAHISWKDVWELDCCVRVTRSGKLQIKRFERCFYCKKNGVGLEGDLNHASAPLPQPFPYLHQRLDLLRCGQSVGDQVAALPTIAKLPKLAQGTARSSGTEPQLYRRSFSALRRQMASLSLLE